MLFLQSYNFEVRFRPSNKTGNADALSRLPCQESTELEEVGIPNRLNYFNDVIDEKISKSEIGKEIQLHPTCKFLFDLIQLGWPACDKVPKNLLMFYRVRYSLDVQENCIFYGDRIFIPPSLRDKILKLIHREHFGIVKCKQIARNIVWWPLLNKDIESFINSCRSCQINANSRSQVPLMSWKSTSFPFERVHIDHFFFGNKNFLIIIDDYSKWIDVQENTSISSICVIESLRKFFAIFGLPKILVSDNGTCFKSSIFERFCVANNIQHKTSPEYHPQSN